VYTLRDLAGNEHIKRALLKAVRDGRVAHAYLLAGPPGVGVKTAALALARALICPFPQDGDACGLCRDCRQAAALTHPDFHLVQPAGSAFKIDQVRAVQRACALKPFRGGRKVFLLPGAENMTAEAANCLLKTLEDPPPAVVFILTSSRPHAVLPTVASRCQQFFFRPLPAALIAQVLTGVYGMGGEESAAAAALAGGSLGRALEWAKGLSAKRDEVLELAEKLSSGGLMEKLELAEKVSSAGGSREEAAFLLDTLATWYRDLLVWGETESENLLCHADRVDRIKEQAILCPPGHLLAVIEKIMAARSKLSANVSLRLLWDSLFLSIGGPPAQEEEVRGNASKSGGRPF